MNKYLLMVDQIGMTLLKEILSDKIQFLQVQAADSGIPSLKVMVMPLQMPLPVAEMPTSNPTQSVQTDQKTEQVDVDHVLH